MSLQALERAIKTCGGQSNLAERVNSITRKDRTLRQPNINKWKQMGGVPPIWVLDVELASGVPCWELRPDIYPPKRFKTLAA